MIVCSADKSGRVLTISYGAHVGPAEMRQCVKTARELADQLQPGFLLLTDLTHLKSMEVDCAPDIGVLMELFSARGMAAVVRVIPDSSKDIGFDLISRFHLYPQIQTRTHASLAEAIKSLLTDPVEIPSDMNLN